MFRITWITLHCPIHESSLLILHWMGCWRYFVASRLEVLLDEDDSRSSSRVREHGSSLLVSQLHVAIQTFWSQCLCPRAEWKNRLVCPHTSLSVLEFVLPQPNKTSFPISWVSKPGGCSLTGLTVHDNWVVDVGRICWESSLSPATYESTSFIQLSSKKFFGGSRGDAYTFSWMISPDSVTTTFEIQ